MLLLRVSGAVVAEVGELRSGYEDGTARASAQSVTGAGEATGLHSCVCACVCVHVSASTRGCWYRGLGKPPPKPSGVRVPTVVCAYIR